MTRVKGNGASAKGLRQVAYFDCPGGGQVVVDGHLACIAHMKAPHGTTIQTQFASSTGSFHLRPTCKAFRVSSSKRTRTAGLAIRT